MKNGVYKITNVLNGDCYVGSCSHIRGVSLRWTNHRNSLRKNKHHSIILQRAWNKYGELNFQFELIEECEPLKCIEREQFYLDTFHPKYNVSPTAGSSLGRKLSPEHIEKLKNRSYDWMRGDKNWNKSPERREFYRERMKTINPRLFFTDESCQKISDFHRGKPKSEQHKKRISEALKKHHRSLTEKENSHEL